MKLKIKNGDEVQVIRGSESGAIVGSGENPIGTRGRVKKVLPSEGKVIVERVRMRKKATRPDPRKGHRGGFVESEAPIPVSSVMLVCSKCNRPVRVGVKVNEQGKRVRVCKKCGVEL